jgi:glutamine amidotransferase
LRVVIVNSGVANVRSVANMLRRLKIESAISDNPTDVREADALILPGVGSFDAAMRKFRERDLVDILNEKALMQGVPVLGLCLGMQLMGDSSEEGIEPGLGWISGRLKKLPPKDAVGRRLRVPHMGWNIVENHGDCVLYDSMGDEVRFYFDHSYYFIPEDADQVCGTVEYGLSFAAGIRRENIFGVQFHPEKSHRFGLALFRNFIEFSRARVGEAADAVTS